MSTHLETLFPGLRATPFRVTSPADHKYNCIAWAANDVSDWWWPDERAVVAVWPDSAAREVTLSAFTAAFSTLGYIVDGDELLEPGFEKVAFSLMPPACRATLRGSFLPAHGRVSWEMQRTLNTSFARWKAKSTAP